MPLITRLMLQNFKKFPELDLRFSNDRNILVGDNESGKSTILLALDLVLSDSCLLYTSRCVDPDFMTEREDVVSDEGRVNL